MKKFLNFVALIAFFIGLLVFMHKVVKPWVINVASSDLFLEDVSEEGGPAVDSPTMLALAYAHCSTYIENELADDEDTVINFAAKPLHSWSLGNYEYVINADFEITDASGVSKDKKFVCRIKYTGGPEGNTSDLEEWSVEGMSGLD